MKLQEQNTRGWAMIFLILGGMVFLVGTDSGFFSATTMFTEQEKTTLYDIEGIDVIGYSSGGFTRQYNLACAQWSIQSDLGTGLRYETVESSNGNSCEGTTTTLGYLFDIDLREITSLETVVNTQMEVTCMNGDAIIANTKTMNETLEYNKESTFSEVTKNYDSTNTIRVINDGETITISSGEGVQKYSNDRTEPLFLHTITNFGCASGKPSIVEGDYYISSLSYERKALSCTQEVKECPDGSFVSRDSYNSCQFELCPSEINTTNTDSSSNTTSNEQNQEVNDVVEENVVCEDGREFTANSGCVYAVCEAGEIVAPPSSDPNSCENTVVTQNESTTSPLTGEVTSDQDLVVDAPQYEGVSSFSIAGIAMMIIAGFLFLVGRIRK